MKILRNSSDVDIVEYPIEEVVIDEYSGKAKKDNKGDLVLTGKTYKWSLKAGETLIGFPDYVADYLMKVYGFLEEVKSRTDVAEEKVPETPVVEVEKKEVASTKVSQKSPDGRIQCAYCDQTFKTKVNYGMHIGSKHADKL